MKQGALSSIQFLRFVAAFMVVVYHAAIATQNIFDLPGTYPVLQFARIGAAGVPIFFVISGFIMYYTAGDQFGQPNAFKTFMFKRLRRIYPIYWVALLTTLLFMTDLQGLFAGKAEGISSYLCAALLFPGCASGVVIQAWTLAYEMYFYLLFGLALFFPRTVGIVLLVVVLAGAVVLGTFLAPVDSTPLFSFVTNAVLLEFLAGMGLAVLVGSRIEIGVLDHRLAPALLLLLALIAFLVYPFVEYSDLPKVMTLGGPSFIIVVACVLSERAGKVPKIIKRLSFLGDSSYSLYLIHILVISLLIPHGRALAETEQIGPHAMIAYFSIVSVIAGICLYYLVERPILTWMSGKRKRDQPEH